MAGPDQPDENGLLSEQPHGRKPKAGRLVGPGGPYRRSGGSSTALARSLRIAQRRPQAILKITRYGHGGHKILGHIHYVSRHGRLTLEDENGEQIEGTRVPRQRVQLWAEQAGVGMGEPDAAKQRNRRVTAHFILDAGATANPEALTKTVRQFLADRFGKDGHEYFFVRHDDTKQPHVHVVLNLMNGQGKRLHTSVAEVQSWRESFAEIARKNGIDVDATRAWERGKAPTRSRGLVRYGAPKPARWTREQVRRGLAARKQRLLSDAALSTANGDRQKAAVLKTKAAGLRMRTDDEMVRHAVAEKRGSGPSMPWEIARVRSARMVADGFRQQAKGLESAAESESDESRKSVLKRGADGLRAFAGRVRAAPTRAQEASVLLQKNRERDAGVERE